MNEQPSWCHVRLYVFGDPADQNAFRDRVRGMPGRGAASTSAGNVGSMAAADFSFQSLVPMPSTLRRVAERTEEAVEWMERHWGPDREVEPDAIGVVEMDGILAYRFRCAWIPPEAWLESVARDFPELAFRLDYYGTEFCIAGRVVCEQGAVAERLDAPDPHAVQLFAKMHFGVDL